MLVYPSQLVLLGQSESTCHITDAHTRTMVCQNYYTPCGPGQKSYSLKKEKEKKENEIK